MKAILFKRLVVDASVILFGDLENDCNDYGLRKPLTGYNGILPLQNECSNMINANN